MIWCFIRSFSSYSTQKNFLSPWLLSDIDSDGERRLHFCTGSNSWWTYVLLVCKSRYVACLVPINELILITHWLVLNRRHIETCRLAVHTSTINSNQYINVTFARHLSLCSSMVRTSYRRPEGYGFDPRQGLRKFFLVPIAWERAYKISCISTKLPHLTMLVILFRKLSDTQFSGTSVCSKVQESLIFMLHLWTPSFRSRLDLPMITHTIRLINGISFDASSLLIVRLGTNTDK